MTNVALDATGDSLTQLYLDVLWNLAASAGIMRARLPAFVSKASDPELLATVAESLRLTTEHGTALEEIASRFQHPARVHAAEVEALLVSTATGIAGWPAGRTRDVALAVVVRTVIHMAIPSYDLAVSLAPVVGHPSHQQVFGKVSDDLTMLDTRLRAVLQALLWTHDGARAASHSAIVAEAEDFVHSRGSASGAKRTT